MTGLSSVAGASLQAQVRAAFDAAGRGSFTSLTPSVVNAAQIAARMLRSAVEKAEMRETNAEHREADVHASSDTARRTEGPSEPMGSTGQSLDVVA